MENKTIQEQIKDTFKEKLSKGAVLSESETKQICEILYQKISIDKAAELIYKIIGDGLDEDT